MTTRKKVYVRSLCLLLALLLAVTAGLVHNSLFGSAEDPIGNSGEGSLLIDSASGEQDGEINAPSSLGQSVEQELPDDSPVLGESVDGGQETPDETPLPEETIPLGLSIMPFALIPLDANTALVNTFADLKTALEGANTYTTIIFGADIVQPTANNTIRIPPTKSTIIIDGNGYQYTQSTSGATAIDRTFYVPISNTVTKNVTVKNMVVDGYNYYGIVGFDDNMNSSGATLTLENITYDGPQPICIGHANANVIDSTFVLRGGSNNTFGSTGLTVKTGAAPSQEFFEGQEIRFYGRVDVLQTSTTESMFWLRGSDAKIIFTAGSEVMMRGTWAHYFFIDSTLNNILVEQGAFVELISDRYGWERTSRGFHNLLVESGGTLRMICLSPSANGQLQILSNLYIDEGASFEYAVAASSPKLYMRSGSAINLNNPKLVLIHNSINYPILQYQGLATMSISAGAINYWNLPGLNGNIAVLPTRMWNKATGSGPTILNAAVSGGSLTSISHNLSLSDDPITNLPTLSNFSPSGMYVLAVGEDNLLLDNLDYADSSRVTGTADPNAALKASFTESSMTHTATGTATASGSFDFTLPSAPSPEIDVTVLSMSNYLRVRQKTRIEQALILVHVPSALNYGIHELPVVTTSYDRVPNAAPDQYIEVLDNRGGAATWVLTASATSLVPVSGVAPAIDDAVVYNNGTTDIILGPLEKTIYNGGTSVSPQVYTWGSSQGLYLKVRGNAPRPGLSYKTTVTWTLNDVP